MDSLSIRSSKKERKFIISAINDILDYDLSYRCQKQDYNITFI